MMRYFEWLFPIMKYVRLRQEVSAWRAALTLVGVVLLPAAITIGMATVEMYTAGGGGSGGVPAGWNTGPTWTTGPLGGVDVAGLAVATLVIGLVLSVINFVEFLVALLFVRHRPGRRRPVCTWQTLKYIALGSQTWAFLALGAVGIVVLVRLLGPMLSSQRSSSPRSVDLWVATIIFTAVITTLIVGIGSIAVQAALGVIALQDDRRCTKCGYFLIGLTVPRCPECGTTFDPAKLGRLAVDEGEKAGRSVRTDQAS